MLLFDDAPMGPGEHLQSVFALHSCQARNKLRQSTKSQITLAAAPADPVNATHSFVLQRQQQQQRQQLRLCT